MQNTFHAGTMLRFVHSRIPTPRWVSCCDAHPQVGITTGHLRMEIWRQRERERRHLNVRIELWRWLSEGWRQGERERRHLNAMA